MDFEQNPRYRELTDIAPGQEGFAEAIEAAKPAVIERNLELFLNGDNDTVRTYALGQLTCDGKNEPRVVEAIIGILGSPNASAVVKQAAIAAIKQLKFISQIISTYRPAYTEAVQTLIDNPDVELRIAALEFLMTQKDRTAQQRLEASLKSGSYIVPLDKLVQLLGQDIHADIFPTLRSIALKGEDSSSRYESIRVLAGDPDSKEVLEGIFSNVSENESLRMASGNALQSLAPESYTSAAKQIAIDSAESLEMRTSTIRGLELFGDQTSLRMDQDFGTAFEQIAIDRPEGELGEAVRRLDRKIKAE